MIAAEGNARDAAAELVACGADVNAWKGYGAWGGGSTSLHSAASNNSLDMVKLLIERGADVNPKEMSMAIHRWIWRYPRVIAKKCRRCCAAMAEDAPIDADTAAAGGGADASPSPDWAGGAGRQTAARRGLPSIRWEARQRGHGDTSR